MPAHNNPSNRTKLTLPDWSTHAAGFLHLKPEPVILSGLLWSSLHQNVKPACGCGWWWCGCSSCVEAGHGGMWRCRQIYPDSRRSESVHHTVSLRAEFVHFSSFSGCHWTRWAPPSNLWLVYMVNTSPVSPWPTTGGAAEHRLSRSGAEAQNQGEKSGPNQTSWSQSSSVFLGALNPQKCCKTL